jgi:hypothetical protein
MSIYAMSEPLSILVEGVSYPCVVCPTCRAKIYPKSLLPAHIEKHEVMMLYLVGQIKLLQYFIGRIR